MCQIITAMIWDLGWFLYIRITLSVFFFIK
jgi:hypothetical protein